MGLLVSRNGLLFWIKFRITRENKRFLFATSLINIRLESVKMTYDQLFKHLTSILKPLTDESPHKLQSTDNFFDATKTAQIPDYHNLESFDVKSLFTSIQPQRALDCTKTAINKSNYPPPLPTDDLTDLLHLCLASTYFQYKDKHYKHPHRTGTADGLKFLEPYTLLQSRGK